MEKLEAHLRGLRHRAVSVFLLREGRVLLQRRALGKYHTPGLWANTCCTHPYWGESANDCAHRRLAEELGISGITLEYRDQVEYRADVGGGMVEHEVVDIFVGSFPSGSEPMPEPTEVMDTIWHPVHSLGDEILAHPDGFTPWLQIYMRDHAALIFGQRDPA